MAEITREQIRKKLAVHFSHRDTADRELIEVKSMSEYGSLGAIFFALNGSPPKGYAIYVPRHHVIWFYDAWGTRFNKIENMELI